MQETAGGTAPGRDVEVSGLPLEGLSTDPDRRSIFIMVGGRADRHLTHTISDPARVLVERTDEGIERPVTIEREGGSPTRVSFRSVVRPEEVDGLTGAPPGDGRGP